MGIEVFPVPASGPTLAEITSAITTNAAPASVTMPAITSSITTNAPGAETWEQISEYKSSTGATNIDFTSIPQTYKKLVLVAFAVEFTTTSELRCRINNDSTNSTYNSFVYKGAQPDTASRLSQNNFELGFGSVAGGQATSSVIEFPNYTSTSSKYFQWKNNYTGTWYVEGSGNYRTGTTTNAITSLRLYSNVANNLFFSTNPGPAAILYGVK